MAAKDLSPLNSPEWQPLIATSGEMLGAYHCRSPKPKMIADYHIWVRLRRELRRQDGGGSGSGSGSGSVAVVAVAVAQSLEGHGRGVR